MTNGNEPAMPLNAQSQVAYAMTGETNIGYGLTKREYFAAMAMQRLLSMENKGTSASWAELLESGAQISVQAADALINELNK